MAGDRAQLLRDEETLAALGYEPIGFTRARRGACSLPGDAGAVRHAGGGAISGRAASALELAATVHAAAPQFADRAGYTVGGRNRRRCPAGRRPSRDVVHWPIMAAEMAAALDHCLAVKEAKAQRARHLRA